MGRRQEFIQWLSSSQGKGDAGSEALLSEVVLDPLPKHFKVNHKGDSQAGRKVVVGSFILFLVVSIIFFIFTISQFTHGLKSVWSIADVAPSPLQGQMTQDEKSIILYGDLSANDEVGKWQALHQMFPEDPKYFYKYAGAKSQRDQQLSKEDALFLQKYDPDNALYDLMLIEQNGTGIEKASKGSYSRKTSDEKLLRESNLQIIDREKYERNLKVIFAAYDKGSLNAYTKERHAEIDSLLGESKSYLELNLRLSTFMAEENYHLSGSMLISDLVVVALQEAEKNQDWEKVSVLNEVARWHTRQHCEASVTLVDSLVSMTIYLVYAKELYYATRNHPDEELRKKAEIGYNAFQEVVKRDPDKSFPITKDENFNERNTHKLDVLTFLGFPAYSAINRRSPRPFYLDRDGANLQQLAMVSQRVEQAFFLKALVLPILVFILLSYAILSFVFQSTRVGGNKFIRSRLISLSLFSPRIIAVFSLSTLLPFLMFLLARYFLAGEALEYALIGPHNIILGSPNILNPFWFMLLIMIYSPFVWGAMFSPFEKLSKLKLGILLLGYIGLFTASLALPTPEARWALVLNHLLLLVMILALSWRLILVLRKCEKRKLLLSGRDSAVIPSYLICFALLCVSYFILNKEEQNWAVQDNMIQNKHGIFPMLEDVAAEQITEGILGLLDESED